MRARLAIALLLASGGCEGARPELAETSARAARHAGAFTDFERWARRAIEGAASGRASEATYETVFAKLRHDETILAAWVQWKEGIARTLSLPKETPLPDSVPWVHLRTHGGIEAALLVRCPEPLAARRKLASAASCVFLRRSAPASTHGSITITVLFHE